MFGYAWVGVSLRRVKNVAVVFCGWSFSLYLFVHVMKWLRWGCSCVHACVGVSAVDVKKVSSA